MAVEQKIEDRIRAAGAALQRLPRRDTWRALTRWRSAFTSEVEAATGKATHLRYEWHAFSYGFSRAEEAEAAVEAAKVLAPARYLVLSAWTEVQFGFQCDGPLPDLGAIRVDAIVVDTDMTWTLVFTHEPGIGPFHVRLGEDKISG